MIFVLLAQLAFAAVSSASAVAENAAWEYTRLDVDLRIDPAAGRMHVEGEAVFTVMDGAASSLTLLLNTRAHAMRFTRLQSMTRGVTATVQRDSVQERGVLRFSRQFQRGAAVRVRFDLELARPSSQLIVGETIALGSWVEAWYPIPQDAAGRQYWAAPGATTFDIPVSWRSVSNGKLQSSQETGARRIEKWHTAVPVNRSFSAAPYTVARSMAGDRDIGVYLIRADTGSARRQAATLAAAISAMEKFFGPYPYATYAIAEVPDGAVTWSASSEQGFIMAGTRNFGTDGNLPLFAHEAAHGWWGNTVRSEGRGAQLTTESLAQLGALLAIESLEGPDAARDFLRFSRIGYNPLQSARGYFFMWRDGGDVALSQLKDGRWDHNISDSKGLWFYHMLRNRIGDDAFFGVLRGLLRDYANRPLSLDTTRARFAAAVPQDTALPTFMREWLDRPGAAVINADWHAAHGRSDSIAITIRQVGDIYHVPLDIEVQRRTGAPIRLTVALTDTVTTITIPAQSPVGLSLDPDHRLLFWRPEYGPQPIDWLAGRRQP